MALFMQIDPFSQTVWLQKSLEEGIKAKLYSSSEQSLLNGPRDAICSRQGNRGAILLGSPLCAERQQILGEDRKGQGRGSQPSAREEGENRQEQVAQGFLHTWAAKTIKQISSFLLSFSVTLIDGNFPPPLFFLPLL